MPGIPQNFTKIKAGRLEHSTLPLKPLSALCQDFVAGFCRRGYTCPRDHEICHIIGFESSKPRIQCPLNLLSQYPRKLPPHQTPFDDDGPGVLCGLGPRHDNDHVGIEHIEILPTTDEILCLRSPFMPRKSPHASHHLPCGQQRHLDILFRQLRYESTESLIDACYHASQQLVKLLNQLPDPNYDDRMITDRKIRYSLFRDLAFEETMFSPSKGLMFRISFACPKGLRDKRLGTSKQLEEGMLVTLVGLSDDDNLSCTFMEIDQRQSTDSMRSRTGNNLRGENSCVMWPYRLTNMSSNKPLSSSPLRNPVIQRL